VFCGIYDDAWELQNIYSKATWELQIALLQKSIWGVFTDFQEALEQPLTAPMSCKHSCLARGLKEIYENC
jgi:hypothetical protein